MRIFHYEIMAYENLTENGAYNNFMLITINHALDEKDALRQAKKLIIRNLYRTSKVWECHQCQEIKKEDELKKETLKFIRKHNNEDHDE